MVQIICTKNESKLTNMVLDRQKVRTDGRRQNYISLRLRPGIIIHHIDSEVTILDSGAHFVGFM